MLEINSDQAVAQHEPGSTSAEKERQFNLIVNGTPEKWANETISFDEIVRLGFPTDPNPNTIYTVTYKHGPKENSEGGLVQGQSVTVKSGMKFYVTPTGQS
jgi:hypothetical protein